MRCLFAHVMNRKRAGASTKSYGVAYKVKATATKYRFGSLSHAKELFPKMINCKSYEVGDGIYTRTLSVRIGRALYTLGIERL